MRSEIWSVTVSGARADNRAVSMTHITFILLVDRRRVLSIGDKVGGREIVKKAQRVHDGGAGLPKARGQSVSSKLASWGRCETDVESSNLRQTTRAKDVGEPGILENLRLAILGKLPAFVRH